MTATNDPQNLPALPQTTEAITQAREQAMTEMQRQLDKAYKRLNLLPEKQREIAQAGLLAAWDIAMMMAQQNQEIQSLLIGQRDQAVTELGGVVKALENADWNHPIVSKVIGNVYEEAMEQHNGNFWESLPYDVAHTMGKGWSHMDAQTLVDLIIDHDDIDDESFAEEHGWTVEGLNKARAALLKAVKKLDEDGAE